MRRAALRKVRPVLGRRAQGSMVISSVGPRLAQEIAARHARNGRDNGKMARDGGNRDRRRPGVGREHCLMLAENAPRSWSNDLGGDRAGKGNDVGPAHRSYEIKAKGGEAVANGDDVSDGTRQAHDRPAVSASASSTPGANATCATACWSTERGRVGRRHQGALKALSLRPATLPPTGATRPRPRAAGRRAHRHHTSVSVYGNIARRFGAAKRYRLLTVIAAPSLPLRRHGNSISPRLHTHDRRLREYSTRQEAPRPNGLRRSRRGW